VHGALAVTPSPEDLPMDNTGGGRSIPDSGFLTPACVDHEPTADLQSLTGMHERFPQIPFRKLSEP